MPTLLDGVRKREGPPLSCNGMEGEREGPRPLSCMKNPRWGAKGWHPLAPHLPASSDEGHPLSLSFLTGAPHLLAKRALDPTN